MSNTTTLCPVLRQRFFDANGKPLVGGLLYSYTAGTSTPQATYTDETGSTPNANPLALDANGEAEVWLSSGTYKFVLTDSLGSVQWTVDNVTTGASSGGGTGSPQVFTLADNQSAYQNITGMLADHTVNQALVVEYTIIRTDGTLKRREHGYLYLTYDSVNGWVLNRESQGTDALNIANSLQITTGGQVQYKSDSMGGTYAGKMTWQIQSLFAAEGI